MVVLSLIFSVKLWLFMFSERQLFFFDFDRPVIDLWWKVSHGVLYTAERLASFGYALSTACFCSAPVESLQHLFFHCPLVVSVLSWLQSIMFLASPLCPFILVRHVLLVSRLMSCLWCLGFLFIWSMFASFVLGGLRLIFVLGVFVKSQVRFNLPLFFGCFRSDCRRRYFVRQWGACGMVASLHNDALVVHI